MINIAILDKKKRAKSPEMIEIEIKQNKNSFFLIEE